MKMQLGCFGWKANEPSLLQQVAEAYRNDMGISNSLFPTDTSEGQKQFDLLQDDPEISDNILQATTFYVQSLAVPARRDLENPEVKRGAILCELIARVAMCQPLKPEGILPFPEYRIN